MSAVAPVRLIEAEAPSPELLAPFDEQTGFDVAAGARSLFALHAPVTPEAQRVVGSAVLGSGMLDLHVEPEFRARGFGRSAASQLLERADDGPLTAWSHEDHPAARALAARFGFTAARALLQLRRPLESDERPHGGKRPDGRAAAAAASASVPGLAIDAFRPGVDDDEWLALNARVFAFHPEQGGVSRSDLHDRMLAPWFRADDFLIARDDAGRMVGYNWLKIEAEADAAAGDTGEIYVIGVAPEASGQGLGRVAMEAGLARLRARGCRAVELYVEADNAPALHLYRALGFVDASVHVQYSRAFTSR